MNILNGTAWVLTGAGEAAAATVGAVGGAAVGSVGGSIRGAVEGAVHGAQYGRRSTPAALATMGALGAAGVVEWPIVLAAGGTALVLRQLKPAHSDRSPTSKRTPVSSPNRPKAVSSPSEPTAAPPTRTMTGKAKRTAPGSTSSTASVQPHP